jgi:F-type H+-transporting ATPase subunit a
MLQVFRRLLIAIIFIAAGVQNANGAGPSENDNNQVDILGKVQNHNYLSFQPAGKIELPRIFVYNGELYFYSSTTSAINSGDGFTDDYYLENEPITEAGVLQPVTYHLVPKDGGHLTLDLSITSHLVFFWISALITLLIFVPMARKYKRGVGRDTEPRGAFQNLFEVLFEFIRDDIAKASIGEEKYRKFVPYLATAFCTIAIMNLLGLLPWGTTSTADLSITATLAFITFVLTQVNASKDHWKHVFWFPGVPVFVKAIMLPIEFVGLFTKPFALAIRLFANMLSGKILIYSIIGLIFVFANLFGTAAAYGSSILWVGFAVFIYVIKAFVALLQAYIFAMLSALFIGMAVEEHAEHEHAHA